MSSLKRLNHQIKLKRMQGKDSARQCELTLGRLHRSFQIYYQRYPLPITIGSTLAGIILARHRRKIKSLYPISTLGINYVKRYQHLKKAVSENHASES